jgi:phosphoadenosine phosphosulfate reductase
VVVAEAAPEDGYAIVSLERFLGEELPARPLGVLIEAGDGLDGLAERLDRVELVAIDFPKFNDGRGFSLATLLRESLAYRGPLRAVGDVLLDLMPHMIRVGFTEFTVTHEPTRRALLAGPLPEMPLFYQPTWTDEADAPPPEAHRPWLRTST